MGDLEQDRDAIAACRSLAAKARCTHRNVGAIVISFGGVISGHGWNKGPEGRPACVDGGCLRGQLPPGQGASDYSDCITVHAEVNAMLMSGLSYCNGSTLYVNSEPCFMCYRIAEVAGIFRVVWQSDGETSMHERHFR
jgi:dCMP deaminase